jgi:lysophospholipase L1-like esterase
MADAEKTEPPKAIASRFRRASRKLLAFVISTLIALFIAELVIRWVAPQVMVVPILQNVDGLQVHRANLAGRGYVPGLYDVTYHTNSQRFRGQHDFSLQPPAGITRIIATGDSFCYGIGVEDDQSFPVVLEASLNKAGQKVEVINAGIGGTGTGCQALWFDSALARFKPKLVVLTVFVNDIEDDLYTPYFTLGSANQAIPLPLEQRVERSRDLERARQRINRVPGYAFLAQHSHLVNLFRRVASMSMQKGQDPAKSGDRIAKLHERITTQGVPLFDAELRWLKNKVEASGAKLVIAWFPTRETIYPDAGPVADDSRWQAQVLLTALAEFSARENVPFFEPTAAFKKVADSTHKDLFFKGADRHAKAEGYHLFGEELSKFLQNSKILTNLP